MTQGQQTQLAEFIKSMETRIEENKHLLMLEDFGAENFVVTCADIALGFTVINGVVSKPFTCGGAIKANRFTFPIADRIARTVKNGAGVEAKAECIKDALEREIASMEASIESLKGIAAN